MTNCARPASPNIFTDDNRFVLHAGRGLARPYALQLINESRDALITRIVFDTRVPKTIKVFCAPENNELLKDYLTDMNIQPLLAQDGSYQLQDSSQQSRFVHILSNQFPETYRQRIIETFDPAPNQ